MKSSIRDLTKVKEIYFFLTTYREIRQAIFELLCFHAPPVEANFHAVDFRLIKTPVST